MVTDRCRVRAHTAGDGCWLPGWVRFGGIGDVRNTRELTLEIDRARLVARSAHNPAGHSRRA